MLIGYGPKLEYLVIPSNAIHKKFRKGQELHAYAMEDIFLNWIYSWLVNVTSR